MPNDILQMYSDAQRAMSERRWHDAITLWSACLEIFPDSKEGLLGKAEALRESGDANGADDPLISVTGDYSNDVDFAVALARNALYRRDWEVSTQRWLRVQRLQPHDPVGYLGSAETLSQSGNFAEADIVYQKLLSMMPDLFWAVVGYARNAIISRRWDDAIERWRVVQRHFPNDPDGFLGEIDATRAKGHLAEAKMLISKWSEHFPGIEGFVQQTAAIALQQYDRSGASKTFSLISDKASIPSDADVPMVGVILSRDPLIVHAAVYSISAVVRPIMQLYNDIKSPIYFLFNSNMSIAFHEELRNSIPREILAMTKEFPNCRIIFLANDPTELMIARQIDGISVELVSNNAFVDENVFVIKEEVEKIYDAIYNARYHPYKRHYLASCIKNLKLVVADITPMDLAELRQSFPHADIAPNHISESSVVHFLNKSRCSLALSKNEGANYASIESLLCGLPIVTTENIGGRDWFFSNDYTIFCEDTPESVAFCVASIIRKSLDPFYIREHALQRIGRERAVFFGLIDQIFDSESQSRRRFSHEFKNVFHDKMNYKARRLSEFL